MPRSPRTPHARFYDTLRQICCCASGGQGRPPLQGHCAILPNIVQFCNCVLPGRARHRPLRGFDRFYGVAKVRPVTKKDTPTPYPWDESIVASWCHPGSEGISLPCMPPVSGRRPAISARCALYARSADVLRARCRRELSANAPLSARLSAVLLPRHSDEIVQRSPRFCRLTIRQSRSPRCRPRISISAEARFVAHGTL